MEEADEDRVLYLARTCTSMSEAERINTGIEIMSLGNKQGQISGQMESLRFPA